MERVCQFLKDAGVYYLATADGDQPRVRPFGTVNIFEGKLYIQTGKVKPVAKQLLANPKAELCAFKDGAWLRVAGELAIDDRLEPKKAMLDAYPELRAMYAPGDGNTEIFALTDGTATFASFTFSQRQVGPGSRLMVSVLVSVIRVTSYPMLPFISRRIRLFISTAYSSGSSLLTGLAKPPTTMVRASASEQPRLMR